MTTAAWIAAIVGGLATFAERFSLLAFGEKATGVPPEVKRALRMIPPAALAALVAPAVLRGGSVDGGIHLLDIRVLAAALAMAVMWRTRQILLTLLVGMGLVLLVEAIG